MKTIERVNGVGIVLLFGSCMTILASILVVPILVKFQAAYASVKHVELLVALALMAPAFVTAIASPVIGTVIDRWGSRKLLVWGTALYAVSGVAPLWLDGITEIVVSRFIFGAAEAIVMTCCTSIIGTHFRGQERERYLNLQMRFIGVAGTVLFFISGALGEMNWRLPFALYGLALLLIPFQLRLPPPQYAPRTDTLGFAATRPPKSALLPQITVMLVGMIAVYLPPVQYPFLLADLGITSTQAIGMGAAFGILSATAGTLLWPVLRRRFNTQSINVLVFALLAVGIWWLSRITSYAESFVVLAVHGLGAGMLVPNVMAWTMAAAKPWHMGKATGQVYFGLYFGQFLSPLLVAPLAASVGGLRPALVVVAAAMALFALIALAIARESTLRERRDTAASLKW
ncbi:MFS transporter [Bradyrhizobium sp. WSM1253]|uniref:MFS transporter n=1 Tax=Bradyrhizobium sp. WSM1253 TaxID=319003 RepID=UPI00025D2CDB|nr:MFS transporter [Bradyrhizobium sp. WSM1253]EIG62155.1 arabinose efflux permease family protein [Bradyrhizobium sp. WSM1253]